MFVIQSDKTICLTRGDVAVIVVRAALSDGTEYVFQPDDVVRLRIIERRQCDTIVLQKDVTVEIETSSVDVVLSREDTKIGELINKPKEYWYEIELNPDTSPQTIIGYDNDGPKIFRLFPEGDDLSE